MKVIICILKIIEKHLSEIIIGISIIIAASIYAYYNPYQSYKRDIIVKASDTDSAWLELASICTGSGSTNSK